LAAERVVEGLDGPPPPPADVPLVHPEQLGDLLLGPVVVEGQPEDFAFLDREVLDRLVQRRPPVERRGVGGGCGRLRRGRAVGRGRAARVVGTDAVRSVEVAGEVDQLAADDRGGEGEEPAGVGDRSRFEGAEEPDGGVLEHVAGVGPPLHGRVAAEHLPDERFEPALAGPQEFVAGRRVAGADALEPALQVRGVERRLGHGRAARVGQGSLAWSDTS
jgi:hypothetical protein